MIKLIKIAMPPKRAVGFLFHLSSRGLATQPLNIAILLTIGVIRIAKLKDNKNGIR